MKRFALVQFLAAILVAAPVIAAPAPTHAAQVEIAHLFDYLQTSGCQFYRNGNWHDAAAARSHLEMKYRYLLDRGLVDSAEQFIDRAATRSSLTGAAYQVRCGADRAVPSADWLRTELTHYRQTRESQPPPG